PAMNFALGERSWQWFENRCAKGEGVGELRIGIECSTEEGRFPLLVLRTSGQHVMRFTCALGHRNIDHHDEFERTQGFAHPRAVSHRVRGVFALYKHR